MSLAIAIDSSASTGESSNVDVNSNGVIGRYPGNKFPGLGELSDPGDSLLSATIASVRNIARGVVGPTVHVAIISFSGEGDDDLSIPQPKRSQPDAILRAPLTIDIGLIEAALSEILESGSAGITKFAPAMAMAVETLREHSSQPPSDRTLVLFISDSPTPILGQRRGKLVRAEPEMKEVAVEAINGGVVFHTFGIGQAATSNEPHTLSRIAGATGGRYRAVTDPQELTCSLADALMP